MTTSEIVRLLRGKKAGNGKWQARCPVTRNHSHGDRNPSLSIGIGKTPGFTVLKCQAGCETREIVSVLGWKMRDLCGDGPITPAVRQRCDDADRLRVFELRHGAYIVLQAIDPGKSNYWAACERNIAAKIRELEEKMDPEKRVQREREAEVQRIIAEYGVDELWECVPDEIASKP